MHAPKKQLTTRARPLVGRYPATVASLLLPVLGPMIAVGALPLIAYLHGVSFDAPYIMLAVIVFLVSFLVFKEINLQNSWRNSIGAQTRDLVLAWLTMVGILLFLGYVTKTSDEFSRRVLLTWVITAPPFILMGYSVVKGIIGRSALGAHATRSAVIVGVNDLSRRLARELADSEDVDVALQGSFDDRGAERIGASLQTPLLGKLSDLYHYVRGNKIDLVYIALPMIKQKRILALLDELRDTTASVCFVPDVFVSDLIQARMDDVNGIPVLAVCESPFFGVHGILKRLSDVSGALAIMILLAPLLGAIALGVKFSSRGPVLAKCQRYGMGGEPITIYRFRTTRQFRDGSEEVTRFGRFLRRTALHDLAQLINVFQGRMSLVGPEPHSWEQSEKYRNQVKGYMLRNKVKPGITGWAQVNGLRSHPQEPVSQMSARIEYDLDYLRHWSLGLDLTIIAKTVLAPFQHEKNYSSNVSG